MLSLDHLVVSCRSLSEGRSYVESTLGASLQVGGQHPLFGTHNLLLGLEDGLYLEVIAIDPSAAAPGRTRWFGLDGFDADPRLSHWVARSDALLADMARGFGTTVAPLSLTRGDLSWQMGVPETGGTPFDGLFPPLIDWGRGPTAAERLPASGCRLKQLLLRHPEAVQLEKALQLSDGAGHVQVEQAASPSITAVLETPKGRVQLS